MTSSYQIAATLEALAPIDTLFETRKDTQPRSYPMDYAQYFTLGDGTKRGIGYVNQQWHWDALSEGMRDNLHALIGNVYITTPCMEDNSTFKTYSCELIWPEKEPEHYSGYVLDLTITLQNLIEVTP